MTLWLVHHHPPTAIPVGVWTEATFEDGQFGYAVGYVDDYQFLADEAAQLMALRPTTVDWGEWAASMVYLTPTKVIWSSWVSPGTQQPIDVLESVIEAHNATMEQKTKLAIEGL